MRMTAASGSALVTSSHKPETIMHNSITFFPQIPKNCNETTNVEIEKLHTVLDTSYLKMESGALSHKTISLV
jgi:hypothetical protein